MTCIIGIRHEGRVYMAADQFLGHSDLRQMTAQKKIVRINEMLIGVSGRPREMNLLKHQLSLPEDNYDCPEAYIVKELIPALRKLLKEHGASSKNNDLESFESYFLVGYKGRLFDISYNYQVTETSDDYDATGSGMYYALGSLHSTEGQEPIERLKTAMKATIHHCPTVAGNVQVEVI